MVGNNRSLKLLILSLVTYAISVQFRSSIYGGNGKSNYYNDQIGFEPPGKRRWDLQTQQESDNDDENSIESNEGRINNNLRGKDRESDDAPIEQHTSPSRRLPKMTALVIHTSLNYVATLDDHREGIDFKEDSMPLKGPHVEKSWFEPNAGEFIDGYNWTVCEPMADWQLVSYPNCNKFHELDLQHMRLINSGGSRTAFEMRQAINGQRSKFVYKTVKFRKGKEVDMKLVEEQRKDSIVMERTSSSKYIPDIHGYCSLAVMMDFMPEGNMHDYIKGVRLAGENPLKPVDRLKLSM